MANPTTNYGFVLPTPTDLVTDLPADFDVALQGVDTRLKALQPGTTLGDLVYSSATANTNTRLGIGTAGQVLAVSGGVPAWTTTADVTPLTTKGDLFTFTTVDARLAVGSNGETLVADSAATTGLRYSATPSASNPVLNSAMQVWQRGTSIALLASTPAYTTDRWYLTNGANAASTVSRQVTGDTTNLPFIQYCARVQRNSGQTGTSALHFTQPIETINSIPFVGKTVTYSFYARAGANYSPASSALTAYLIGGTGTDQQVLGFTGATVIIGSTATLTTTWQRFSYSATVGTTITQLGARFDCTPVGTAGANDYYEITGVQIDIGSVALPFRTYAATIQGELAACERYCQAYNASTPYGFYGLGYYNTTTLCYIALKTKTTMRTSPTATFSAANLFLMTSVGTGRAASAVNVDQASPDFLGIYFTTAAATAGNGANVQSNNSYSSQILLSAEL